MSSIKAWKDGETGAPSFPTEFEIVKKAVLQVTDIKTNHNKYYAIELHKAKAKSKETFRIYTHYGRTDDLETNPNAGQKECRYFATLIEAQVTYESIYREKTSSRKGYKELSLASSKIGSHKARGTSSGAVDDKTLEKLAGKGGVKAPAIKPSKLHPEVQALVRYLYGEATSALTSTVAATITAHGIETPLGILTIGQIEKGEAILGELYDLFKNKKAKNRQQRMEKLSGDFYTAIPHRIGRSRSAVASAVINTLDAFQQKQDTLQLMKDMLKVNGEGGNVLFNARIDTEYEALKCQIGWLEPKSPTFRKLADYVVKSQVDYDGIEVKNIFTLKRAGEWEAFTEPMGNQRLLFHGSGIHNWVGILSRGILLPKIVVSIGGNRTDEGWLGHGIYFGDAASTSANYTSPGKKGTSLMTIARVALGRMKDYTEITYGLARPPAGYDSCHGVRCNYDDDVEVESEFDDDEYVIYDNRQQRLEYLVEFTH
jgi:poly [ADP-ribose] polymerase